MIALLTAPQFFVRSSEAAKASYGVTELRSMESPEEAQIRNLRDQEIAQLRIALGRRLEKNRRADLYLRLAELYVEAYRAAYLLEGKVHEKRLQAGQQDRFTDHAHSHPFLKAAIKACQDILALKIRYAKMDQVYYFLGYNHGELGNRAQALKYLNELVSKYPNSQYAGDAHREMGDAAFDKGDYRKAQAYYEQANRQARPETKPRILHKLAWSYYRTRQFDRAVATMKEAVSVSGASGEKFLNLREEALKDMALFMTESGKVEEAITYFQEVVGDRNYYPKALERLGKMYERNVEPAKATQVYESLLKTNPESEASFRVLVKIIDLELRRARFKEALKRLEGVKIPRGGDQETQLAAQNLRAMIRRTATEHHEQFRKKKNRGALDVAENFYSAYLGFLAAEDPRAETAEIQMYLAEVKRDLGKSKEASALYRKVLESRDKRYAKEAGALWTASLADAIKNSGASKKGAADPSELEKEFVAAADQLQEALGETNEGREAALRAAQVLAGYKNTQSDAESRVEKILKKYPKSPQAVTAARLWIQMYSDRGADGVSDLKDAMEDIRENEALMAFDAQSGGKLKATLGEQDTQLKIGRIASDEKEKDYAKAAKGYEALAAESQQRDLAEKAYSNAIASYIKAEDAEAVTRVSDAWLKRYPKTPKASDALRSAATHFLIKGGFDLSTQLLEKLGRELGEADSLETAARIAEGNGAAGKAQELWAHYLSAFPKAANKSRVMMALAKSREASGQDGEAAKIYRQCAGIEDLAAECGIRLAALHYRAKDSAAGKSTLEKVAKMKASGRGSAFVAYARFQLADQAERDAKFEPLRLPEAQLKKALNQRLSFLEPLSRAYSSAVEAGGPWAVAALDRLGNWAFNFAQEVDQIPPPNATDPKAVAEFQKNLSSISAPLRKKAIATWSEAYQKAVSAEALSPALPELGDRLADAQVKSPVRAQGHRGKFRLAGVPADGDIAKTREKLFKNAQDGAAWVDYGNLLWGQQKPLLARLAYDRALSLNSKNPAALNNRAVVVLSGEGEEDWLRAAEGNELLQDALKQDGFFIAAKLNRATLLNYYRLFAKARPLWEQSLAKNPDSGDLHDGLAIALQGTGGNPDAEFQKASDAGASKSRFAAVFHRAAKASLKGAEGASICLDELDNLDAGSLFGFERDSAERLKQACTKWKGAK